MNVFKNAQYPSKVLIAAFTKMLFLYEVPFVSARFTQILDLTVTLLQLLSENKTTYFSKEED